MLSETEKEQIRRAYHVEKKSIRQIARDTHYARQTIEKVIENRPAQPYRQRSERPAPVFGPYRVRVDALLQQSTQFPRKQQYTAHRIFEILQSEGYQGSESSVRNYVYRRREADQAPEAFLPLEFEPGQDAQVDWGEATVILRGQRQVVQLFVMRLCYSRRTFAMTFPTQKQESFFWAHVCAFKHFSGVPHRLSYDNLATAVKLALDRENQRGRRRAREEVRSFTAFRSYYLFESFFCTPAQGHEKGQVEHGVGYIRRNFLVPLPTAESFEDLNQKLLDLCLKEDHRRVARQPQTIGEAWEQERPLLLSLPPSDYECCDMVTARLTAYSQATYETNRYSVPVKQARKWVTLKAYPFTIEIFDGEQKLCSHPRCYEREKDVFDPLHYLPLIEQRPNAFEYAKPLKQWKAGWPASYHQMLANLRKKWPEGRGIQEFIRILQLHERYPAAQLEQAIEHALSYGCVHLDGVLYCLHEAEAEAETAVPERQDLDGTSGSDLHAESPRSVDLSRYERLLKLSW